MATAQLSNGDENEPIQSWFYTSCAGSRVIGYYAYITAFIWHLGVCQDEVIHPHTELSAAKFLRIVHDYSLLRY